MRAQATGAVGLRDVLVPWRLAPIMQGIELDQDKASRVFACLSLIVALCADIALLIDWMPDRALLASVQFCALVTGCYCGALLLLSLVLIGVTLRR